MQLQMSDKTVYNCFDKHYPSTPRPFCFRVLVPCLCGFVVYSPFCCLVFVATHVYAMSQILMSAYRD